VFSRISGPQKSEVIVPIIDGRTRSSFGGNVERAKVTPLRANRIAIFSRVARIIWRASSEGIPAALPSAGGGESFADRTTGNRAAGGSLSSLIARRRAEAIRKARGSTPRLRCKHLTMLLEISPLKRRRPAHGLENFRADLLQARRSDDAI